MYQIICDLPRSSKKLAILLGDLAAIVLAITLAVILRMSDPWPGEILDSAVPFYLVMAGAGLIAAPLMGIPQIKISAFDLQAAAKVGLFALVLSVAGMALNLFVWLGAPRTVPMIFGPLMFCLSVGWKVAAHGVLDWLGQRAQPRTPVAVYGAGAAGVQLISALSQSAEFRIVAVVDDNPSLRGVVVAGHAIQAASVLDRLAQKGRIERILLAIPSLSKTRQRAIVQRLERLPCEVQALPAYVDIIKSGGLAHSLKPVSSDDLLGRDAVDLDLPEIAAAYRDKVVMVSGAGGSIGSELCRQVLNLGPRKLVLFERSEIALYTIDRELGPLAAELGVDLATVLGSVCDPLRVEGTLALHEVDIVLHAAAYKHVPLVEQNELEGVRNNIFGTRVLAEAAERAGCERFILISTDKAVRPTNVMGATKRMAEMVVQDLARQSHGTRFAMVRFGNVLGSSGSVIPLFQGQIASGGPVTLTHPEVTRFFMTVPEAARLVLLAGSFAGHDAGAGAGTGGKTGTKTGAKTAGMAGTQKAGTQDAAVFVLDMGSPVKILDLARKMIALSGLSVRDTDNPDGDIPIEVTGLRPGEKLYEELLIDDDALIATPHTKILRAHEDCPTPTQLAAILTELRNALETDSPSAARKQIEAWVEGYHQPAATSHLAAE